MSAASGSGVPPLTSRSSYDDFVSSPVLAAPSDDEVDEASPIPSSEGSPRARADYAMVDEAVSQLNDSGVPYTLYGVLASYRGVQGGAYRRFSEFHSLHEALVQTFPELEFPMSRWPWLPGAPSVGSKRHSMLCNILNMKAAKQRSATLSSTAYDTVFGECGSLVLRSNSE
jgi:hypothetical protein